MKIINDMRKTKILIVPFLLLSAVIMPGCKKLDLAPTNRFSELTFWSVSENVSNALNNIYGSIYNSNKFFYNEALSDNAFTRLGISAGLPDAISSGNFTTTLSRFLDEWRTSYSGIKSCNLFLENADKNTTLTTAAKDQMKAQVRFVRAWHHFNLVKWWGDIPVLKKDPTPDEAKNITRSSHADAVKFILDELDAAAAILPSKDQYAPADRGRITRGAALALKARVLLYEGNRMADVAAICEQLMNDPAKNGNYSLFPSYPGLFAPSNEYNSEVILDLQYVPNLRTWNDYIDFSPLSAGARSNNLAPTQELVNSYIMLNGKPITDPASGYDETNPYINRDPRLTATVVYDKYNWLNPDGTTQTIYIKPGTDPDAARKNEYKPAGQGTATGYYWRKYFDPTATTGFNSGLNLMLIRYADVLLMYAEAKNSQGQMSAAIWDKTIRLLRQRAGFTDPAALDYPGTANMAQLIMNERRSEFAMEGLRIDDIRRWKMAETVLNGWAHGAKYGDPSIDNGYLRVQQRQFDKNRHYLWPVPAAEIALDKNLTQNPNY